MNTVELKSKHNVDIIKVGDLVISPEVSGAMMLCQVSMHNGILINLESGNRYDDALIPLEFYSGVVGQGISKEKLKYMIDDNITILSDVKINIEN